MKQNHIEFLFGGYGDGKLYEDYLRSHDWETVRHAGDHGLSYTHECRGCEAIRQHASGTIDFHFGCAMVMPEEPA